MAAEHLPEFDLFRFIDHDNIGSIKLAESMGAVYEKTIPFRDGEASIYRHKK